MTEHIRSEIRVARDSALHLLASQMSGLTDEDWIELARIPVIHRFVGRGSTLIEEGTPVTKVRVLSKGWAVRDSRLDETRRQVLDIVLPGQILGLAVDGQGNATSRVEALTACEVGEIDKTAFEAVMRRRAPIAVGVAFHLAREIVRADDQVTRLGRMTAYERVCSLLLEIYTRQRPGGRRVHLNRAVDFPATQTLLADVLGLSVVHVNRQIMRLRREGAITLTRRQLVVHDEGLLARAGRFEDRQFGTPADHALLRAS